MEATRGVSDPPARCRPVYLPRRRRPGAQGARGRPRRRSAHLDRHRRQRRGLPRDPGHPGHLRRGRGRLAGVLPRPGRPRPVRGRAGHQRRPRRPGGRDRRHPARSGLAALQNPLRSQSARTDARQAKKFGGPNAGSEAFHEGIKRLKAAVAAGADMVFMESPRTEEECRTLVKEMGDVPVLINVLPNVSNSLIKRIPRGRMRGRPRSLAVQTPGRRPFMKGSSGSRRLLPTPNRADRGSLRPSAPPAHAAPAGTSSMNHLT